MSVSSRNYTPKVLYIYVSKHPSNEMMHPLIISEIASKDLPKFGIAFGQTQFELLVHQREVFADCLIDY